MKSPDLENKSESLTQEEFLTRWSRLKRAARAPEPMPGDPADIPVTSLNPEVALTELTDADMPPVESLDKDSDYRGFLSPKVSEALRKQALRKLFLSPEFNVRDGLDDYDEEYTQFAKLGDIVTADMRHQLETEAQHLRELALNELKTPTQTIHAKNESEPAITIESETLTAHADNAEEKS